MDSTPLRDTLANLTSVIDQVIDHAWLSQVDFDQIKDYIGDHPALAENDPVRKFRQLLWDVVGCEAAIGDWQQLTSLVLGSFIVISSNAGCGRLTSHTVVLTQTKPCLSQANCRSVSMIDAKINIAAQ